MNCGNRDPKPVLISVMFILLVLVVDLALVVLVYKSTKAWHSLGGTTVIPSRLKDFTSGAGEPGLQAGECGAWW